MMSNSFDMIKQETKHKLALIKQNTNCFDMAAFANKGYNCSDEFCLCRAAVNAIVKKWGPLHDEFSRNINMQFPNNAYIHYNWLIGTLTTICTEFSLETLEKIIKICKAIKRKNQ